MDTVFSKEVTRINWPDARGNTNKRVKNRDVITNEEDALRADMSVENSTFDDFCAENHYNFSNDPVSLTKKYNLAESFVVAMVMGSKSEDSPYQRDVNYRYGMNDFLSMQTTKIMSKQASVLRHQSAKSLPRASGEKKLMTECVSSNSHSSGSISENSEEDTQFAIDLY